MCETVGEVIPLLREFARAEDSTITACEHCVSVLATATSGAGVGICE